MKQYSYLFKASLLEAPRTEFTGTVSPIEKVPNWLDLTDAERLMTYDQIPKSKFINIPEYKISDFQSGMAWSSTNGKQRNSYITYPVPNLGNYKLDGTENSGSHPGIDIKAPIGTPIRAIANGVVYKTGNQVTGFGQFVSIIHNRIGEPKITMYSNYAHMSKISVNDGQTVKKGQIIGEVGNTGMATTPHLHFQLDTEDAPFHPYWPFGWEDVQNAGYRSYFEAVKQGVGKSNAKKYTIHPIDFIVKYEDYHSIENLVASTEIQVIPEKKDEPMKTAAQKEVPIEDKVVAPKEAHKEAPKKNPKEISKEVPEKGSEKTTENHIIRKGSMSFDVDKNFTPGKPKTVEVYIDKDFLVAAAGIEISSTLKTRATITPEKLYEKDFKDGVANIVVETDSQNAFKLVAKGDFGEIKSNSLRPQVFSDVPSDHIYHTAIVDLKNKKIINGYADGTFKPEDSLNRAESLKIILVSNDILVEGSSLEFKDVKSKSWYFKYVGTALKKGIVKGYEDMTFRPGNMVTRAEFIKMAILSSGKTPAENVREQPYPDVKIKAWYAKYFQFAKKYELLKVGNGIIILPNEPITRGEAADIIYRLGRLK